MISLIRLVLTVMVVDMYDIAIFIGNYWFLRLNVVSFTWVIMVDMKRTV